MVSATPFGVLLKQYRVDAGLTQSALAGRAGLSVRAISDLERGVCRTPHHDTLTLLLRALDLAEEDRLRLESVARRPPRVLRTDVAATPNTVQAPAVAEAEIGELLLPLTPIVGREHEEAAALHLLARPEIRLLTLVGPPGIGKTRLALLVAAAARHRFADGVSSVALASTTDASLVPSAIAQALSVRATGTQTIQQSLRSHLRDRQMLLVLDNFEQVLAAGPLVVDLLAHCPHVKLLVTSRATLHVRGEHQFVVPPLAVPDSIDAATTGDLAGYEAVRLFVQRARAFRPTFALTPATAPHVGAICRHLEGIPLAIELAAAHINLLPPAQLLARLQSRLRGLTGGEQDLPPRQQSLRRTLDWSYELLDPDERQLWRRLAVFSGGWTLEDAETLFAAESPADTPRQSLLEAMAALVRKSLVVSVDQPDGGVRCSMLETLREYALERLAASDEWDAWQRRHALHFLALAEAASPHLRGPQQEVWFAHLAREHDNLRAALRWAEERDELEIGLRLASSLWWFWQIRGHLREGRDWLERLLARDAQAGCVAPAPLRAAALEGAGNLAWRLGEDARAVEALEACLGFQRAAQQRESMSNVLNVLGLIADEQGQFERAVGCLQESLALRRELSLTRGIGATLSNLGNVAYHRALFAEAARFYGEGLVYLRQSNDTWAIAVGITNLGASLRLLGRTAEALSLLEEGLELHRKVGEPRGIATALINLGIVAREHGDLPRAFAVLYESARLNTAAGHAGGIRESLDALAEVSLAQGRPHEAVQIYAVSSSLCTTHGLPRPPADVQDYERAITTLRAQLDEGEFVAAWQAGERMAVDQILDVAREARDA